MILTGFRKIKPNAANFNGQTVTMVCTAIGKTEQGKRDHFFVLIHAASPLGKHTTLGLAGAFEQKLTVLPSRIHLKP